MKPVHICGSDDAIVIGRTRFGGYALRNVTRTIRCATAPKLRQQLALSTAAHNSFGQPWAALVANVAQQASGSKGGMSLSERRQTSHQKAAGRIASLQSRIASLEGRGMVGRAALPMF